MGSRVQKRDSAQFILRLDVAGDGRIDAVQRTLLRVAAALPGARLSRTDYTDRGDHRLQLRRKRLV